MANVICHVCSVNLALKKYEGDLKDDNGDNPCLECVLEAEAEKEEAEGG
jgi:hypothetical protein